MKTYRHVKLTQYVPFHGIAKPPVNELVDVEGDEGPVGITFGDRLIPWGVIAYRELAPAKAIPQPPPPSKRKP